MDAQARREPTWSGLVTRILHCTIPARRHGQALTAIKAIHTAIFGSIAGALALTLLDGLRGRPTRRTVITGGIVLAETALYVSNNQVCPLTPLAEELGAESGSVVDLYLPAAFARHIPLVAGTAFALAVALNLRTLRRAKLD